MEDTRNSIRRVDATIIADGHYLLFGNRCMKKLFNKYGKDYFSYVERGLLTNDTEVGELCLANALMTPDDTLAKISFDDLDYITMGALYELLLDGFSIGANGRSYKEQIAFLQEEVEKAQGGGKTESPPPTGQVGTSETSNDAPSE